jgi:uncharacterized protein
VKPGALFVGERCLLPRVWRAEGAWERARGLLGRPTLGPNEGFWIEPCASVHTIGMGYPLDLAFLDRDGRVRKLVYGLPPLRLASGRGARATLETAPGTLAGSGLREGDRVVWREAAP